MMRKLLLVLLLLNMTACSGVKMWLVGKDTVIEATELKTIKDPLALNVVWKTRLSQDKHAHAVQLQLASDGESVFAATQEGEVSARNLTTGAVRWTVNTGVLLSGGVGLGDSLLAVASSEADLILLNSKDGHEVWRTNAEAEILSVPVITANRVIVQTVAGSVIGYDVATGERLWVFDSSVPVLSLRGSSSPLIVDDLVLSGSANGKLFALDFMNGWMKWESSVAVPRGRSELDRMVDLDGNILADQGVVFATSFQGRVVAIDLYSGRVFWARDFSSYSGIALDERQLYLTDEEGLVWALDRRNGASLWKQDALKGRRSGVPVIYKGYLAVGDFEGYVHLLSTSNGQLMGRVRIGNQPFLAAPLVVGDYLLVYGENGDLALLTMD
ncbi:MAG: outer membrane protein assembly factor BamB [Gammaproteobacteria bacterium]|nr:outer membrane protein assembly factor BamB [Gammaproteobacteria bacterium]